MVGKSKAINSGKKTPEGVNVRVSNGTKSTSENENESSAGSSILVQRTLVVGFEEEKKRRSLTP